MPTSPMQMEFFLTGGFRGSKVAAVGLALAMPLPELRSNLALDLSWVRIY